MILIANIMKKSSVAFVALAVAFSVLEYRFHNNIYLTLAITFGTMAYHLCMRLVVGYLVDYLMKNDVDYNNPWFCEHDFEKGLYEKLGVKKWKSKMPTYNEDSFSLEKNTKEEIAMAMCQAEIVHEIIIILSFVPIFAISIYGAPMVFIITSALAAMFDLLFVIIQRYNRPRILRLIKINTGR